MHDGSPTGGCRRSWRDVRIDPGRPGALAVVLVGVVAAVVAAVGVWREAPRAEPVADLPVQVTTVAAAPSQTATAVEPETLVVAVAGKVRRPGLVRSRRAHGWRTCSRPPGVPSPTPI